MTTEPLKLAREIRDRVSELTGLQLPRPRTVQGLNGSLATKLPLKLHQNLALCVGRVHRAARCIDQGREADAITLLHEALDTLTPELVKGPPDLAREIRDRISELTGHQLPAPRGASGLYHSIAAIPLKDLDEPLAARIKRCRALLRPPQRPSAALDFTPPLADVLALLAE